jgi:VCBS repeat-containing protein
MGLVPLGLLLSQEAQAATYAATASVTPTPQYLGDSTGTTFTFTVNNTGTSTRIGAVEIDRPSTAWTIVACPTMPPFWRAQVADTKCRYRADANTAHWIAPGQSAQFSLTATTTPGSQDRTGTWPVEVSKTNAFDTPSALISAPAPPSGTLQTTAYSFEVLDVGVPSPSPAAAGAACPVLAHKAITGSTQTIQVCGRNRTTGTLSPNAANSSLGGTWIASPGTFSSGAVAAGSASSASLVLGTWSNARITGVFGTGNTVIAKIGSASNRTSPLTTFTGYEATNRPPVANNDTGTTDEDHSVSINVLANDTDPDGDAISIQSYDANGGNGGTITQGSATNLVFNPGSAFNDLAVGQSRTSTFAYTIQDTHGATATATVTVTVTGVNDPPTAVNDTATTDEDHPVNITVLANDTDPDNGDVLTVVSLGVGGTTGQVTSNGTTVDYSPNGQFDYLQVGQTATDTFTYTISDGHGGTSTASVTVTITGVNDPPVAVHDAATTDEDHATVVNVLLNDTDPDATDTKTVSAVTQPAQGTAAISNGGADVTFNPHGDFESLGTGQNGLATFTYTVKDSQGATSTTTVDVTVTGVNDAPTANDVNTSTLEDTPVNVVLSGTDAEGSALTFDIATPPANGTLSCATNCTSPVIYTPNADDNGSDGFTYKANDGTVDGAPANVSITVTAVNDAPSFAGGGDVTVLEDSGAYSAAWASSISPGPADESGQTVAFAATNDDNGLFSVQPAVASDGTLTFTPAADANGSAVVTVSAKDNGGTANGGHDTSAPQTFKISVTAVNDAPSFTKGGDVTVLEDSGAYSAAWASSISPGPADESGQTVTFAATNDDNGLFSVQPAVASDGTLTFTPAADANGSAVVTVSAKDNGGTANGGHDTSAPQTFKISVTAVNDAPSFTKGANDTGVENTPRTASGWATNIKAGPADESGQTLAFNVAAADPSLFTVQPAVDSTTGDLTYTPAGNAGSTIVTVSLSDNGGTANGGVDTSPDQTFAITVKPPNTAPVAGDVTTSTNEDHAKTVSLSATDDDGNAVTFTFGQGSIGTVSTSNSPSCDANTPSTCTLDVTYTPNANANGPDSFTYKANDGQVDSNTATVNITVNTVNDAPSFTKGDDQTVDEDAGPLSVPGWATGISPGGGSDESGQTLTFHTTTNNDAMFSTPPSVDATTGDLTYQSAPDANGAATVTISLSDNGGTANGGSDTSANQTFTITVNPVNDPPVANDDTGATTEDTFTNVSVLTNDTDVDGDTLSVSNVDTTGTVGTVTNNGDGTIKYNAAGHFDSLAEGATTTDTFKYTASDGNGGTDDATVTITITGVNDAPVGVNDSYAGAQANTTFNVGVTCTGPCVTGSGSSVLANDTDVDTTHSALTATVTSPTPSGANVTMNTDGTFSYLAPQGFTGTDTFTYTVHDNDSTNPKTSTATVSIQVVGPVVWYVDNSKVSAGDGRSSTPFNAIAPLTTGGSADAKDGSGDIIFVYSGAGNYTGGLVLEANQKLLGQPQGLTVNSHVLVAASGSNPSIVNAAGDAITLANGVDIERVDVATGSSGAAVKGTSITTATYGSSTTIHGGTGGGVDLSGNASGNISIGAAITSSAGHSVAVSNRTGGTVALSGNVTDTGTGISLSNNTGGTVNLTGQLSLTTTTHFGFTAVGGGTVNATNANNSVRTTTGTAVDIANTTIGSSGVVFTSVSANGAANGIVLNNTGSTGSFSVTGDGSTANSGGAILNTTSHAISLTSTQTPTFAWMNIQNPAHAGVKGTQVHGFSFTHGTVTSFGSAASNVKDAAFAFNDTSTPQDNLDGAVTIARNAISNGYGSGVDIDNYSGTISDANISNNTLTSSASQASSKGDAITMNLLGTAGGVASLTKAEITSNAITNFPSGNGIVVQGGNTASSGAAAGTYGVPSGSIPGAGSNIVTISFNTIVGDATNHMAAAGILASVEGKGSGNFTITNNGTVATPVKNMLGQAIGVGVSGSATANFFVTNNVVAPDSAFGSTGIGVGTDVNIQADSSTLTTPTINAIVVSNTVSQSDGYGIEVEQRDSNGTANVEVSNNSVSAPKTSVATSIEVMEGSTGSPSYNPTLCAAISGNTAATALDDGAGDRAPGITLDKLVAGSASYKFGITGLPLPPATAAQTEVYVATQNPGSGVGTGFWGPLTVFAGNDGFTSCTLPF